MVIFGTSTFVPPFIQGVLGGTAVTARHRRHCDVGRLVRRQHGGRPRHLAAWISQHRSRGRRVLVTGSALLVRLSGSSTLNDVWLCMAILGLGLGLSSVTSLLSVQSAVDWRQRGVATSSNQFFRTVGGTLGISVIGAVFNSSLSDALRGVAGAPQIDRANALLTEAGRQTLSAAELILLQAPLEQALNRVYMRDAGRRRHGLCRRLFLSQRGGRWTPSARAPSTTGR